MLGSGKFWAGVVTGVIMVYGYNMYRASKSSRG